MAALSFFGYQTWEDIKKNFEDEARELEKQVEARIALLDSTMDLMEDSLKIKLDLMVSEKFPEQMMSKIQHQSQEMDLRADSSKESLKRITDIEKKIADNKSKSDDLVKKIEVTNIKKVLGEIVDIEFADQKSRVQKTNRKLESIAQLLMDANRNQRYFFVSKNVSEEFYNKILEHNSIFDSVIKQVGATKYLLVTCKDQVGGLRKILELLDGCTDNLYHLCYTSNYTVNVALKDLVLMLGRTPEIYSSFESTEETSIDLIREYKDQGYDGYYLLINSYTAKNSE